MLFYSLKSIQESKSAPPTQLRAELNHEALQRRSLQAMVPTRQDLKTSASKLGQRVGVLTDKIRQSGALINSVGVKADQALQALQAALRVSSDLRLKNSALEARLAAQNLVVARIGEALSGNIKLYESVGAEDVSAAALNAAAAGTFEKELTISLVSETTIDAQTVRLTHPWALLPVVVSAEAVSDPDVAAPTVEDWDDAEAIPAFRKGVLHLRVIFDTDAGATKTYTNGDSVTVTIKTASDSKLLGWPVANLVKTYDVIA